MKEGKDIIINNNYYTVISIKEINKKNYALIINRNDYKDFWFCTYNDETLTKIEDKELIKYLIQTM